MVCLTPSKVSFNEVQLIDFFLSWIMLLMLYLISHCWTQGHLNFSPTLPSGSFMVLCFTFRAVIHFQLVFVKGIMWAPRLIFLHVAVFVLAWFIEKSMLFPLTCLLIRQRSVDCICVVLFLSSLFISLIYWYILSPILHCFDNCNIK